MSGLALTTGLKSLLTSQFLLDTVGHNIANANTPGYSRQRVEVGTALSLQRGGLLVGGGVEAVKIARSVDTLLNRRMLTQIGVSGRLESQVVGMTQVEAMLGDGDGQGIGGLMDAFFASVGSLSSSPEDSILRTGMAQSALTLTTQFNSLADSASKLKRDTIEEIGTRVKDLNLLAKKILALNVQITETEGSGAPANDLRDQRDVLLEHLGKLADAKAIEEPNGAVRVLVGGTTLVSTTRTYPMRVERDADGDPLLLVQGGTKPVNVTGGAIGGLLQLVDEFVPGVTSSLDEMARSIVLEMNRVHSTGIPVSGPFKVLNGTNRILDLDQDGKLHDELLSNAGLPFDVQSGVLYVNVTSSATGAVEKHQVEISRTHTTVGDFLGDLNAIPHLSADLDSFGRIRIVADGGFGFDFSRRLDPNPDAAGTFGGGRASLGTSGAEPFALSDGDTIDLTVGGTSFSVALSAGDFADASKATAEELAAALNADPGVQSTGLVASVVGGRVFLQTLSTGSGASFTVDGGSALGALGWSAFAGQTVQGHDDDVDVEVFGSYTGKGNDVFTFRPTADGVIGTTPNLFVEVFDSEGNKVATLDLGEGYQPGEELQVADGVSVSFGLGTLSATHNDLFTLDVVADSDTTDVLVALGVNSLMTGSTASDVAVREDLEADPSKIASSGSGTTGDNSLLLDLLDVQSKSIEALGKRTLGDFYGDIVGGVGFELGAGKDALEANGKLMSSLDLLRQQVSGVNVDEETVDMLRYEQAFAASAQFIGVVNSLNQELLSLI